MKVMGRVHIGFLAVWISMSACQQETVCTTEFRSIGIRVLGDSLTDFYTVRTSTLDTIRRSTTLESRTHLYVVLDDTYQSRIANTQEQFTFIGKINNHIVVNEAYVIKADGCHIDKVSGKSEVQL